MTQEEERTAHKYQVKTIQRIDRSPMNPKVWCVQLSCGHDEYVYRKPRSDKMKMECTKCPKVLEAQP